MDKIMEYLPVLIPLILIQFGLMIAALIHICKSRTYRMGNRTLWIIVSIIITVIGPVLYFVLGRSDEGSDE